MTFDRDAVTPGSAMRVAGEVTLAARMPLPGGGGANNTGKGLHTGDGSFRRGSPVGFMGGGPLNNLSRRGCTGRQSFRRVATVSNMTQPRGVIARITPGTPRPARGHSLR